MSIILNAGTAVQDFEISPMSISIYNAITQAIGCAYPSCSKRIVIWSGNTFMGDTTMPIQGWHVDALSVHSQGAFYLSFYNYTGSPVTIPGMTSNCMSEGQYAEILIPGGKQCCPGLTMNASWKCIAAPSTTPPPTPASACGKQYAGADGIVQKPEALQAVVDYFAGTITKQCAIDAVVAYFGAGGQPDPGIPASIIPTETHTFDITISPYSWYTPQGAADYLVTHLADISGAIINLIEPLTGWTVLKTEVINDGNNVTIRVHLNNISALPSMSLGGYSINTLLEPVTISISAGTILTIIVIIGVITLAVGMITAYALTRTPTGTKDAAKQFAAPEVVNLVLTDPNSIVSHQLTQCNTRNPSDAAALKNCTDAVIIGAQEGLADHLKLPPPKTDVEGKTKTCIDQYNIDHNRTNYEVCLKGVSAIAGAETQKGVTCPTPDQYYNVTQGKCIQTDECWIPGVLGSQCILSAKTGKTILIVGGIVIGTGVLYSIFKK